MSFAWGQAPAPNGEFGTKCVQQAPVPEITAKVHGFRINFYSPNSCLLPYYSCPLSIFWRR